MMEKMCYVQDSKSYTFIDNRFRSHVLNKTFFQEIMALSEGYVNNQYFAEG